MKATLQRFFLLLLTLVLILGSIQAQNNPTFTGIVTFNNVGFAGSAVLPPTMLGKGVPSSGTVLFGDGRWRSISAVSVGSVTGTANEITATTVDTAVTLSLPSALVFSGKTVTGGTFTGGTYSGSFTGNLVGVADSATVLANTRTINGVGFNGSSNITVTAAANTLTGSAFGVSITSAPGLLSYAGGPFGTMALQNSGAIAVTGGTMNSVAVTGLPAPVANNDAVRYIDLTSLSAGITQRTAVQLKTTANVTLSGEQTIDGVLTAGSRLLVGNQSTTANNGIYVTAAGAWSRATDSNTAAQLKVGYYYFVQSGSTQGSTAWTIQTAPTTLGTDPVVFGQFSASQTYSANSSTGIQLVGTVFSLLSAQNFTSLGATTPGSVGATTVSATTSLTAPVLTLTTGGLSLVDVNTGSTTNHGNIGNVNGTFDFGVAADGHSFMGSSTNNPVYFRVNGAEVGFITSTGINGTGIGLSSPSNANFNQLNSSSGALNGTLGVVTRNQVNASNVYSAGTFRAGTGADSGVAYFRANDGTINSVSNYHISGADYYGTISNHPVGFLINNSGVGFITSTGLNGMAIGQTTAGLITGTVYASDSNADVVTSKNNFHVIINVKDYGALGNNSANDTAAIVSAFAAAPVNSVVYFPRGIYLTDQISLTSGTAHTFLAIVGDGMGASIIKHRTANDTNGVISVGTDSTDITIQGLTFDGNCTARQAGAHAVILYGSRFRLLYSEVKNSGQFSVYTGGGTPTDGIVNNNYIHNGYADGINLSNCSNSVCIGNNVDLVGDDCFVCYGTGSFNIICTGNLFRGWSAIASTTGRGIFISSGAFNILCANNKVDAIQQDGLLINNEGGGRCHDISLKNNQFTNCSIYSSSVCTIRSADRVTLEGNDASSTNNGDCINFADVTDFVVKGGTLYTTLGGTRGIHADESSSWNGTTWTRINFKGIDFICTNASFCQAIYLNPYSGVTMSYLTIDSNTEVNQVTSGDYITIGGSSVTGHKICNNISSHGFTIHDFAGSATIVNNN